jgi:hypothetical protein
MQSGLSLSGARRAYGPQISQTVYYLFGHPLWVDCRRLAPGMQIKMENSDEHGARDTDRFKMPT